MTSLLFNLADEKCVPRLLGCSNSEELLSLIFTLIYAPLEQCLKHWLRPTYMEHSGIPLYLVGGPLICVLIIRSHQVHYFLSTGVAFICYCFDCVCVAYYDECILSCGVVMHSSAHS